jgi:hypothetical protein
VALIDISLPFQGAIAGRLSEGAHPWRWGATAAETGFHFRR